MTYLYERGKLNRVMHLCYHSIITGEKLMKPLCGSKLPLNTTCNLPLGRKTCKKCLSKANKN